MLGPEWHEFTLGAVRKAPCIDCGAISSWYPAVDGWVYRYCGIRGGTRRGSPKVRTERLCAVCRQRRGIVVQPK